MTRWIVAVAIAAAGCSAKPAEAPVAPVKTPADAQHAGITTPHGDHSPHHAGMVMMNGDNHFEVVFAHAGKHPLRFSDSVRQDHPAPTPSHGLRVGTPRSAAPGTPAGQSGV